MMFIRVDELLSRKSDSMLLSLDSTKSKSIQPGCPTHVLGGITQTQEPTVDMEEEYEPLYSRNDENKMFSE